MRKVSELFELYMKHVGMIRFHATSLGHLPDESDLADRAIGYYLKDFSVVLYTNGQVDIDQVNDCFDIVNAMCPDIARALYTVISD